MADRDARTGRLEEWRGRTGVELQGAFAFGDTPALMDQLLADVRRGTKRATVGSLEEQLAAHEPFPEPGQFWGLIDGAGERRYVMETVEVTVGALGEVTPAFAWDEGEGDRTIEDWIEGHRRFFARQGWWNRTDSRWSSSASTSSGRNRTSQLG